MEQVYGGGGGFCCSGVCGLELFLVFFADKLCEGQGIGIIWGIPDLEAGIARIGEGIQVDAYQNGVFGAICDLDSCGEVEFFLSALIICVAVIEEAVVLAGHYDVYAVCFQHIAQYLGYFEVYGLFHEACRACSSAVLTAVACVDDYGGIFWR